MKLNGKVIEARFTKVVTFKRDPEPIQFTLQSFLGDEDFEKLCPTPVAPTITRPGGETAQLIDDPGYLEKLKKNSGYSLSYMSIMTLQDIEWETVDMSDPDTWENWREEMGTAGFSSQEVVQLQNFIFEVNGLSEDSVSDAVKNLPAGKEGAEEN